MSLTKKQMQAKLDRWEHGLALLAAKSGWMLALARESKQWTRKDEEELDYAFRVLRGDAK